MNVVKTIFIDYNCVHLLCLVPEINVIIIIIKNLAPIIAFLHLKCCGIIHFKDKLGLLLSAES